MSFLYPQRGDFFGARHCLLNAETIDLDPSEEPYVYQISP